MNDGPNSGGVSHAQVYAPGVGSPNHGPSRPRNNMAYLRGSLRKGAAVCLTIAAALCALFGLALIATAISGNGTPSSILLGGSGFILLIFAVPVLIFAIRQWSPPKPGPGS
jgi:hypothetical protein